ncbi:response regulator transcription factor [Rhodothermus marinus]|uniref:response regulator transcription factor n=1 Tax=Rhodothermus marinus TaxID=29549 RepID=UPI0012BA3A70|nr:response regulator transcription factor [Rhodothermus marinus]BBM69004.1 DNA-binding response regulator [Rhodothermus marinus]
MAESTPTYHMLIVEDDADVAQALQDFFELQGYRVTHAPEAHKALEMLTNAHRFDVVLLDVMLPDRSGFEVLEEMRRRGLETPVLVLTGRGEREQVLQGFGLGADDYIVKPFDPDEVAARVRAILQRTQPPDRAPMQIYRIGDVEINFSTHEAYRGSERINFTAMELNVLRYLIHHRGEVVTREQLLRDVWHIAGDVETRTIDRHIASIRKKIEPDLRQPRYIETVYGKGYRLRAEDQSTNSPPTSR